MRACSKYCVRAAEKFYRTHAVFVPLLRLFCKTDKQQFKINAIQRTMKNLKRLIFSLLIVFPFLQSCNKDDMPKSLAMVTVKVINEGEYYFVSNRGNTLYPGDKSEIGPYPAEDGQRAFIYFEELPEPASGYDYNIKLYAIEDILTKPVIPMTDETRDSIGDDPATVSQASITGGYLNLEIYVPSGYRTCMLNLVENRTGEQPPFDPDPDYTYLEFRVRADGAFFGPPSRAYVSFKLNEYDPALTGKKGIIIRSKPIDEEIRYIKIEAGDLNISTVQYQGLR